MLYFIITCALILLSVFVFLPRFSQFTQRYNLGINFFLTLVATLVGVFLAISITNYETVKQEKQDVIKLLLSSISSVETCHEYTRVLVEYHNSLPAKDGSKADFYVNNPPPYPDYLDIFLTQNIVSKNLSGASLSDLNELLINLKRSRTSNAPLYLELLKRTQDLLQVEVSFQQGNISHNQLEAQLDTLNDFTQSAVSTVK
ncbi:hypothetical protein ACFSJY_02290 [Thalassotalea euphylliae]|uniref:hypothetical protein n=1 Tax=Thalassotalea euphylliae TaxID=1655234 RepID=UPI0036396562